MRDVVSAAHSDRLRRNSWSACDELVCEITPNDGLVDDATAIARFPRGSSHSTPATSSHGCQTTLSASGTPSASLSCPFTLSAGGVEGAKSGIVFYGINGSSQSPRGNGFLCVNTPTQRTGTQSSGGSAGACNGSLLLDFNAFMTANPSALRNPLVTGQTFSAQAWRRDPPATKSTNMSDALTFDLAP